MTNPDVGARPRDLGLAVYSLDTRLNPCSRAQTSRIRTTFDPAESAVHDLHSLTAKAIQTTRAGLHVAAGLLLSVNHQAVAGATPIRIRRGADTKDHVCDLDLDLAPILNPGPRPDLVLPFAILPSELRLVLLPRQPRPALRRSAVALRKGKAKVERNRLWRNLPLLPTSIFQDQLPRGAWDLFSTLLLRTRRSLSLNRERVSSRLARTIHPLRPWMMISHLDRHMQKDPRS